MLIEGPYGSPPALHNFDSILFLVGGTGIAVPLSHMTSLLNSKTIPSERNEKGSSRTTNITVVWAVREIGLLEHTMAKDLKIIGALDSEKFRLCAHVTRNDETDDQVLDNLDEDGAGSESSLLQDYEKNNTHFLGNREDRVQITRGRPNVKRQIWDAFEEAGDGRLAVVACGPGQMADEARKAVVGVVGKKYGARVEYFEESFKW
jgi:hypothetical protein